MFTNIIYELQNTLMFMLFFFQLRHVIFSAQSWTNLIKITEATKKTYSLVNKSTVKVFIPV
jgi:hypothetical protein